MHFPLLYADRLLMPVFSDITMPYSARVPVGGQSCLGPSPGKETRS